MNGIQDSQRLEFAPDVNPPTGIEKRCSKCGEIKLLNEFGKERRSKSGYASECKSCRNKTTAVWQEKNRAAVRESNHRCYFSHKEKRRVQQVKWNNKNKHLMAAYAKKWRTLHPEKTKDVLKRHRIKMSKDPMYRLNGTVSHLVWQSIKKEKGNCHWENLVGFSLNLLMKHLEKQFAPEMTWENYGPYWHIDHIIPKTAFNFEKPSDIDFRKCWMLKNLRPLEKVKNIKKSNKVDKPFQPSLLIG